MLSGVSLNVASPEFVGRAAELAQLTEVARAAAEGDPGFVLIGGESGVGKSRLVTEFSGRAEAEGARVLVGDCVDLGGGELPYAPLVGALRGVSGEELSAILGRGVRDLAPLLPQLESAEAAPESAALAQARLYELLLALIRGLGEQRPLVLIIEDAHWADPSTRDFLTFLMRNRRHERLLVVVTYRTDELHRRHPLRSFLAEADRARTTLRLALERLTRPELAELLSGILGAPPAPGLVDELFERAEGNPFFTEELLAAGGGAADGRLPDNIRDALMLRIESLSAEAQSVLRVAAAAGARMRHRLLAAAAPLEAPALLGGLREAVAHQVLIQEPDGETYRFRHALLREAIADDLLPGERGPLHAALGRALAAEPGLSVSGRGVAAELAAHWTAAHDLPQAFAASAQAGAEAERMAAFAQANAHYERAAELWDAVTPEQRAAGPTRVELLRRAAEAAYLAGDGDRATALARGALALVDPEREPMLAATVRGWIGRFLWVSRLSEDALTELAAAAALMPADAPPEERARVLSAEGHVLLNVGRAIEARDRCESALPLAREAGARTEECRILNTLGGAQGSLGSGEAALATLLAARELAHELDDSVEITRSYINMAEVLDRMGRLDEAIDTLRAGTAWARREGIHAMLPMFMADLSARLVRHGDWDEAAACLTEAISAPMSWGVGRESTLAEFARLEGLRGDAAATERMLAEVERDQRQAIGAMWTGSVAVARAEAALWDGRPESARAAVEAELGRRQPDDDAAAVYLAPLIAAGARAEAELSARARAVGDAAAEAEAVNRARTIVDIGRDLTIGEPWPEASLYVEMASAESDRAAGRASAQMWARVAAGWEERGNVFQAAYARWRQAELTLAAGGPRREVPAVLAQAHSVARRLGAAPLRRELEDLARRARIELTDAPASADGAAVAPDAGAAASPGAAQTGADSAAERVGLTARELDVLRLLAAGATNREIAGSLYISQKTVSVHVTRILSKLDARTRVEAAGLAQRLGLLEPAGG
jgi:DNA-binding CsgD family transcriptional regulator/tetratricopeptide (TPR) repeat protein